MLPGLLDRHWVEILKREEARFAGATKHALSVNLQLVHRSARIREFVTSGPQIAAVVRAIGPDVWMADASA